MKKSKKSEDVAPTFIMTGSLRNVKIESSGYDDIDNRALAMIFAGYPEDEINAFIENAVTVKVEKAVDSIGFKVKSMDLKKGIMTIVPREE